LLPGSPSVLIISHRLSAVAVADRICFIAGGRVVEEGTHGEMMARDGRYVEAFRLQNVALEASG